MLKLWCVRPAGVLAIIVTPMYAFFFLNNICSWIVAKNFQIILIATIAAQAWICGHDGDVDDHMMVVNILTYCHLYLYFYADPKYTGRCVCLHGLDFWKQEDWKAGGSFQGQNVSCN